MTATTERPAAQATIPTPGPGVGILPYRWVPAHRAAWAHQSDPTDIHRIMLTVEDQAAVAWRESDGDPVEAHALLTATGCHLTAGQVDRLFELSQAASDAELVGGLAHWDAKDEYIDYLHHLAITAVTS